MFKSSQLYLGRVAQSALGWHPKGPCVNYDYIICYVYSWARHFTLTVPLSTQVYKWVPANLLLGGNPAMD